MLQAGTGRGNGDRAKSLRTESQELPSTELLTAVGCREVGIKNDFDVSSSDS